ncbi:MAG: cysteine hydrolase family protein [Candidatus Dormibacteraceae bacterium]
MVDFVVVPERTALLNVDLQNCFVEGTDGGLEVVERVNRLAAACRQAGIVVIHTSHALRPDGSNMGVLGDVAPLVKTGFLNKGSESAALHPQLVVDRRDLQVEKPRFGAFYGTDLELILRSRGIDTVIITGIETNVCCDTTAREANARDFRVLFLSDATSTAGNPVASAAELQKATLATIGTLFGQVLSVDEVLLKINAGSEGGVIERPAAVS